jgi:hypothetical protein
MSGPGWLQSALTLGGGSLASSMFLGIIGGYEMLWVQPLAMILGVIMLGAISYVTLSIESSPFEGIRRHINPVLAWGWLLGALFANMVWALPQYSLAYAVLTDNLFPSMIVNTDSLFVKFAVSTAILILMTLITWGYGSQGRSVRVYEWTLTLMVGLVVLSFVGVVVRLTLSGRLPWGLILTGLMPNPRHLFYPTSGFERVLENIVDESARLYWTSAVLDAQRDRMVAAASAAVGINMTFLMPYALLAKGWNRKFRGLAVFDLSTGLLIPFVLVTGSVVIASASQFHTRLYEDLVIDQRGRVSLADSVPSKNRPALESKLAELNSQLEIRKRAAGLEQIPLTQSEVMVASMLLPRDTRELASSLETLFGSSLIAHKIFGVGVLAMGLSTISLLMLISGFAVCEALGVERSGPAFRWGSLCAATGVLWPLVWSGNSKAYLAIAVGTVGYTLLPIALITFLFMLNSPRLLKAAMPSRSTRWTWNLLMGIAMAITGTASVWTAWHMKLASLPIGRMALGLFPALVVAGFIYHRSQQPTQDNSL